MYVTGRLPLLVALGVVPLVLLTAAGVNAWAVGAGWVLLCTMLALLDALLAPSARGIRIERRMPRRSLLGQPVETELALVNTGERQIRGRLRDAWQPTAGAPAARIALDLPAGERRRIIVPLLPRRRGEQRFARRIGRLRSSARRER